MRQWVLHIIEALPGCWCHYRCRWSHEKKSCCCCCCRLSCSTSRWWNKVKRAKMLVRLFILNYSIYITWSNWDLHYFYFYANSNFWISGLTWIKCAGYEYARAGKSRLFNKGPTREKGIMQIRYIFHVSCSLSFPFYPLISWCDRKSCDVTLILSILWCHSHSLNHDMKSDIRSHFIWDVKNSNTVLELWESEGGTSWGWKEEVFRLRWIAVVAVGSNPKRVK